MNVYEKLQKCKADLQGSNLKKTGKNAFAHYDYWELSDYLPTIVSLFLKIGLCSYFSFGNDLATLTIVNTEKPEESITITSPMAAADLKCCLKCYECEGKCEDLTPPEYIMLRNDQIKQDYAHGKNPEEISDLYNLQKRQIYNILSR